jgi:hypothetical protein
MAKKFRGAELVREIDEALDRGLARFLILTQGKLSKSSPVDTGRLASSWFIGAGVPDRSEPPKRKDGDNTPSITKYDGRITMDRDWFISSNLDYSERVAFDPKYGKGGRRNGAAWFTTIANNAAKDAEKSFDFFLRKVK